MRLPATDTIKSAAMLLALAGLGYALWRTWQASGKAVESVSQAAEVVAEAVTEAVTVDLNPANPENIVNRGAVALTEAIAGEGSTPGNLFYEATHDDKGEFSMLETLSHTPIGFVVSGAWDEVQELFRRAQGNEPTTTNTGGASGSW